MDLEKKEKLLTTIHEWTRATDQKISIFLAFLGIFFTTAIDPLHKLFDKAFYDLCDYWTPFFVITALLFVGAASVYAIWGLKGRFVASKHRKRHSPHSESILFFKHIADLDLEDFRKKIHHVKDYEEEVENQIHANSKVCSRKLGYFNSSIFCFLISIGCLIAAIINYFYVIHS